MHSVCLVHGLIGGLSAPEILDPFKKAATVTAPDLLGYGQYADTITEALTLDDQAYHVNAHLEETGPAHLVGHSVGGAVSVLVASKRPDLLKSFTSVEGNFTLNEAFWSAEMARKEEEDVQEIIAGLRANPVAWLRGAIETPGALAVRLAPDLLANQPASTIHSQAKAVVEASQRPDYLEAIRSLCDGPLPVHLIAGTRSAAGWDTPDWANEGCTARVNIPNTGHLMMIEDPEGFAAAVMHCIALSDAFVAP